MSYADRIKAKIKEADVEKQLHELVDEGEKLVTEAVSTAGEIAYDRRADVQGWLDRASEKVNEKTEGKYADKVAKVTALLLGGVDKIAEQRSATAEEAAEDAPPIPLPTAEPGEPEPPAASATEPSTDAPAAPTSSDTTPPSRAVPTDSTSPFSPETPFPPAPDPDVNPSGDPSVDPEAPGGPAAPGTGPTTPGDDPLR